MGNEEIPVKIDRSLADLTPKFLASCRQTAGEIRRAIESGDVVLPRRIGHSLKGTGGSYGFDEIALLGGEIERAASEADMEALRVLAERLERYVARVRPVFE
jgi:HPt (histidine-containing phosphotransfer) domain-containing protein